MFGCDLLFLSCPLGLVNMSTVALEEPFFQITIVWVSGYKPCWLSKLEDLRAVFQMQVLNFRCRMWGSNLSFLMVLGPLGVAFMMSLCPSLPTLFDVIFFFVWCIVIIWPVFMFFFFFFFFLSELHLRPTSQLTAIPDP